MFTQESIVEHRVMENILQENTNEKVELDKENESDIVTIQYESDEFESKNHDLDNIEYHHYNLHSKNQLLTCIDDYLLLAECEVQTLILQQFSLVKKNSGEQP